MSALNYGQAIAAIRQGHAVARYNWIKEFIFMRPEDSLSVEFIVDKVKSLPAGVKEYFANCGRELSSLIKFKPYLCKKNAADEIENGWAPTMEDILATDYHIL